MRLTGSGPDAAAQSAGANDAKDSRNSKDQVRIVLRPIGSPLPLGFAAFGIGSFIFALQQIGVIAVAQSTKVTLLLVIFLAPLQFIASVVAFAARETLTATGLALLAFSWPATYALSSGSPPGSTSPVLGCFYLALGGFLLALAAPGLVGKPLIGGLIVVAAVRFVLSGSYELSKGPNLEEAAGAAGMLIVLIGLYGAVALALEDVRRGTVLPVGRRGPARTAFEGALTDQFDQLEHEAGVRRQL